MRTRQLVIFLLGLGDTRVSESAAEGSGFAGERWEESWVPRGRDLHLGRHREL